MNKPRLTALWLSRESLEAFIAEAFFTGYTKTQINTFLRTVGAPRFNPVRTVEVIYKYVNPGLHRTKDHHQ